MDGVCKVCGCFICGDFFVAYVACMRVLCGMFLYRCVECIGDVFVLCICAMCV